MEIEANCTTSWPAGLGKSSKSSYYSGSRNDRFFSEPALYLVGYFEVLAAGRAGEFGPAEIESLFGANFHVRHRNVFEKQKDRLVVVKGFEESRLLKKAVPMSVLGEDVRGKPSKILSPEMQEVFGGFGGKLSFQRSPTRWVEAAYISGAADFVRSLE